MYVFECTWRLPSLNKARSSLFKLASLRLGQAEFFPTSTKPGNMYANASKVTYF